MPESEILRINGWVVFKHPCFADQVEFLKQQVIQKKKKDPHTYSSSREAKLLAAILKLTTVDIPANPADPGFRLGNALGAENRHWFRAKFYQQYRLFFRFDSASKIIIYAWINDEETKGKAEKSIINQ